MFLLPLWFFSFWPLATPVNAETMNWSSTMFGGSLILAMIYYVIRARHVYPYGSCNAGEEGVKELRILRTVLRWLYDGVYIVYYQKSTI